MRIAILTKHTLDHGLGGVQVHADGLARGLRVRGHEIVVFTTSLAGRPEVVCQDDVEVRFLAGTPSGVYSGAWWRESVAAFERLHRKRPFDLVVSEGLAGSSLLRHFPEIPHMPFLQGLVLEHVVSELRQIEEGKGALRYLAIKLPELIYYTLVHERPLVRRAPMVATVSRRAARLLRRCYQVPEATVRLLPNWVDVDVFRPDSSGRRVMRGALGVPPDDFVFLMVSVLTKQKGVQIGLEAFARLHSVYPRSSLLIVGDGPYRPMLEQAIRARGLQQKARVAGSVPNIGTVGYYQAADAFLFPTLRVEGIPFVVLEAMASALPVIGSRIGGVPETVGDGGFLVPSGDVRSVLSWMRHLVEEPELARATGEAGRQHVKRLYAKGTVLAQLEEVCRELVGGRR